MTQNFQQGIPPSATRYFGSNSEFYLSDPGMYCPPVPQVNPNSHPQYCDLHPSEPPNPNPMAHTGKDQWSSHGNFHWNQNHVPHSKCQQMSNQNFSLAPQTNYQHEVGNQNSGSIFAEKPSGTNPYTPKSKFCNPETEVTTGTVNFKDSEGKGCEKVKGPNENENERSVKTFMGFVTSLDGDLGYIDKEVLFHASAVKGLVKAKKDDYVLVKAESVQCLPPIKWNAKIVQVLDKSFCPENTKLQITPEQPILFQNVSSQETSKSSRNLSGNDPKHLRAKLPVKIIPQSTSSSKSREVTSNGQKCKSGDDRGPCSDRSRNTSESKTNGKDLTSSSNQRKCSRKRSSEKGTNECSNEKSENYDTKRTKLQGDKNSFTSSLTTGSTEMVSASEEKRNKVITDTRKIIRSGHKKVIQIQVPSDTPEKSSDGQNCNSLKSVESVMDRNIQLTAKTSDPTESQTETMMIPGIQENFNHKKSVPHLFPPDNCNRSNYAISNNNQQHLEIYDNTQQNVPPDPIKATNHIFILLEVPKIQSKYTDLQEGKFSEKLSKKSDAKIPLVGNKKFGQESAGEITTKTVGNLAPVIPVAQLAETPKNIGKEKPTKKFGNQTMVANAGISILKPLEDVNYVQNLGSPEIIPLGLITIKKEKPDENSDKSIRKCVTTTELPVLVSKIKTEKCEQKSAEKMTIQPGENVSPIISVLQPTETHNHIAHEKPSDKLALDNRKISPNTVMAQKPLAGEINHVQNSGSDSRECEKITLGSITIRKDIVDESGAKSIPVPKLPTTSNIKIKKGFQISTEEILIKSTENSASTGSFEENGQNSVGLSNAEINDNEKIRRANSRVEYSVTDSKNDTHPPPNLNCTEVNKDTETNNATNIAGTKPPNPVLNKKDSHANRNEPKLKTLEQAAIINSRTAHLNAAQLKERNDRIRMIDIRMDRQCHGRSSSFGSDHTNVQYRMDRRQFGQFDNHETFFRFDNHQPRDSGMPLLPTPPQHITAWSEDRYKFRGPSCHVCFKDEHHGSVCWHNSGNGCRCCGKRSHGEGVCWYRHDRCESCGKKGHRANMCRD